MYVKLVSLSVTAKVGDHYVKVGQEVELAPNEYSDKFKQDLLKDVEDLLVKATPGQEAPATPAPKAPASKVAAKPTPAPADQEADAQPEAPAPDRRSLRGAQKDATTPKPATPPAKPAGKPAAKPAPAPKKVAYDRTLQAHKTIFGDMLDGYIGKEWRTDEQLKKDVAGPASQALNGVDFLDAAGAVLPEFVAALEAQLGVTGDAAASDDGI